MVGKPEVQARPQERVRRGRCAKHYKPRGTDALAQAGPIVPLIMGPVRHCAVRRVAAEAWVLCTAGTPHSARKDITHPLFTDTDIREDEIETDTPYSPKGREEY